MLIWKGTVVIGWVCWTVSSCYLDAANILFGHRKSTIIIDSIHFAYHTYLIYMILDIWNETLESFENCEDTD